MASEGGRLTTRGGVDGEVDTGRTTRGGPHDHTGRGAGEQLGRSGKGERKPGEKSRTKENITNRNSVCVWEGGLKSHSKFVIYIYKPTAPTVCLSGGCFAIFPNSI